jgi:hypothetical protein
VWIKPDTFHVFSGHGTSVHSPGVIFGRFIGVLIGFLGGLCRSPLWGGGESFQDFGGDGFTCHRITSVDLVLVTSCVQGAPPAGKAKLDSIVLESTEAKWCFSACSSVDISVTKTASLHYESSPIAETVSCSCGDGGCFHFDVYRGCFVFVSEPFTALCRCSELKERCSGMGFQSQNQR